MKIARTGEIGFGTTSPSGAKVHVVGAIRMVDGNEALDRIMVASATGVGSWKDIANVADPWLAAKEEQKAPASMTVTYGTLSAGAYSNLAAVGGTDVHVDEAAGANALQISLGFTGVTLNPNQLLLYGNYDGNTAHQIAVEIYNNNTTAWDRIGLMAHSTVKEWNAYPIYEGQNYVSAGAVTVRLRHLQSGSVGHDLYLDYVSLRHNLAVGGGVGVLEHGQLEGLDENDHPQYGKRSISYSVFATDESCTPGTGVVGFVVPEHLDGFVLTSATAAVDVKGVDGTMTIQLVRKRAGVAADMLSSALSIGDAYWSDTMTINASYDDVAQGDMITVDVDTVHTSTSAMGLSVVLTFEES